MNRTLDKNILLYSPVVGYNQLAKYYAEGKWFKFWNENEIPIVRKYLETIKPKAVLDAGCGTGIYLNLLMSLGVQYYTGVDISEGMLKHALMKNFNLTSQYKRQISFIRSSIEKFSTNIKFDTAICTRVLSNNNSNNKIIENICNNLTSNGYLILSDVHPLHNYQHSGFETPKGKININTYKHSLYELRRILKKYGFMIQDFGEYNFYSLKHKPLIREFEKLYTNPENMIFYTVLAQKV